MTPAPDTALPRPALAFRIGVTGSRRLDPDQLTIFRKAVADILALAKNEITGLAEDPAAQSAYLDASPSKLLRVISPLAEGADRLVAEEGLRLGAELDAPLPFAQDEFEKDFPQTVRSFRELLAQAKVLTLDGARDQQGDLQNESYSENGRFVVRNCDLLIALWDGKPARGLGGTAEIVRFATQARCPVWWIDAIGSAPPRLLLDPLHLQSPEQAPAGEEATAALKRHLAATILPPDARERLGSRASPGDAVESYWNTFFEAADGASDRLLAELCRWQPILAMLGRALALEKEQTAPRLDAWTAWYFTAALRAAPFLRGDMMAIRRRALALIRACAEHLSSDELDALALDQPLASRRLGDAAMALATATLQGAPGLDPAH